MTNSFYEKLLVFHYIFPQSWHKIQQILKQIGDFDKLFDYTNETVAKYLNIKTEKATQIKILYKTMRSTSMQSYYQQYSIQAIPYGSDMYPSSLMMLYDAPAVLYVKGDIRLLMAQNKMAVIGSRAATHYSEEILKLLLPPLINEQFVIVSGLAKGADRIAHELTIHFGGRTIGVLGHGFSHFYPKDNEALAKKMAQNHLLLTEYPPYVGVQKWHFPARNRIISGLSQGLLVTEAALKSGTLITTELALEQGKDVFVVPGNIFSEQSKGTNKLLKEGAICVWNGHQILEEMQMFSNFR
jgi:DNA processing protein